MESSDYANEFAAAPDPNRFQTGIDLSLKPGEMIIYNLVNGNRVVIARKVNEGDWKLEGDVYPAYVTEVDCSFDQVSGHRSLVRCVFETNTAFNLHKLPIINVSLVGRMPAPETVELGEANFSNGYDPCIGSICYALECDIPDGKWKITATRVG